MEVIKALDIMRAKSYTRRKWQGAARGTHGIKTAAVYRGVRVGWLKEFIKQIDRTWSTADVVERWIKPRTARKRCRYVDLLVVEDVGESTLFVSHTWGAPFFDLVIAIAHVASDDMFVWVDIFAVRQWPGNVGDLDFRPIVRGVSAFLLVARHLDEVAKMDAMRPLQDALGTLDGLGRDRHTLHTAKGPQRWYA